MISRTASRRGFASACLVLGMLNAGFAADDENLTFAGKEGRLLWVLTNGTDRPICGRTYASACRSISQAIANADDGDSIVVGAGRYGDLNGDGAFSGPGDERPACDSVICINKRLRIFSRQGAQVTTIDADTGASGFQFSATVRIQSDGVIFGSVDHGFTLTGSASSGLIVGEHGLPVNHVQVVGNIALRNGGAGFSADSIGRDLVLSHNIATGNGGVGFQLVSCNTGPCGIVGNVTLSNNQSFANIGGGGFAILNTRAVIVENVASNNPAGGIAILGGDYTLRNNAFVNNFFAGVEIQSATVIFTGNTVTGNFGPGLFLEDGSFELHGNNIFANSTNLGVFPRTLPPNCGLVNIDTNISATNNFWGAATGPGADPADSAGPGSGCDSGSNSITHVKPFATGPFPVRP